MHFRVYVVQIVKSETTDKKYHQVWKIQIGKYGDQFLQILSSVTLKPNINFYICINQTRQLFLSFKIQLFRGKCNFGLSLKEISKNNAMQIFKFIWILKSNIFSRKSAT